MRKNGLLFMIFFTVALFYSKAQDVVFEYDNAGNCIVKYKTVVLPSHTKQNNDSTKKDSTVLKPQIETIADREVLIYPNPTKGALKIEIKGKSPEKQIQYILTDLSGKTVMRTQNQEMVYSFDMSRCLTGVYLLTVIIDDKWSKWKIIKE